MAPRLQLWKLSQQYQKPNLWCVSHNDPVQRCVGHVSHMRAEFASDGVNAIICIEYHGRPGLCVFADRRCSLVEYAFLLFATLRCVQSPAQAEPAGEQLSQMVARLQEENRLLAQKLQVCACLPPISHYISCVKVDF